MSWRRDFRLFWFALGASATGDQVREFAIPLIAISVLHVSASDLGILGAAQWLPFLVLALPLGVIIDRHRRRSLLIASEVSRGLVTAALIVAIAADVLGFPILLVAVILLGVFTVIFEVGYQSVIPSLVPHSELGGANARTQATVAAAEIGGPGVGGVLLQAVGALGTMAVTAGSYLFSAAALVTMRGGEPAPATTRRHFLRELRDGARHVIRDRYLRANVGFSAIYNPLAQWITLLLTLYAVRELGLEPAQVGLIFSAGAVGALVGSALSTPLTKRMTVGTILIGCAAVECSALLFIPLVDPAWGPLAAVVVLSFVMACNGMGTALSSVLLITIRQLRTPNGLLGRVNATMRTVTYGTIPLGALAGGFVAEWLGPRLGIAIGAVLCLATIVWVWFSPLRRIHSYDDIDGVEQVTASAGSSAAAGCSTPRTPTTATSPPPR